MSTEKEPFYRVVMTSYGPNQDFRDFHVFRCIPLPAEVQYADVCKVKVATFTNLLDALHFLVEVKHCQSNVEFDENVSLIARHAPECNPLWEKLKSE